jgi:hypothetical protein
LASGLRKELYNPGANNTNIGRIERGKRIMTDKLLFAVTIATLVSACVAILYAIIHITVLMM